MSFTTFSFIDDDEDDLFVSQSKSKIGSLFENDSQSDNTSLSYQRKKQPKKDEKPAPKEDAKSVTTPSIFYTGKAELYINSAYKVIGIAIVDNKKQNSRYQLILYYTRESYVTTALIRKDFAMTFQSYEKNYYASFYDDQRKAWSLRFLSQEDSDNFGLHLAVAKYLDSDLSSYILQDLYMPEKGHKITPNDKIAIDVVEYVFKEGKINETNIIPNIVTFVGSSKNKKGWDIAIEGSRKLSRRIIVVQENSEIKVFKIEITKLKRDGMIISKPQTSNRAQMQENESEQVQETHNDEKVDLLRRVAKLGIQIPSIGNEGLENDIRDYQTSPNKSSSSQNHRGQSPDRNINIASENSQQDYYPPDYQRQNHPHSYQPQHRSPESYQPYYPPNQPPQPSYQYPPNQQAPYQYPTNQHPPYQQQNYYNPQQQYYNPTLHQQPQFNHNQSYQLQPYQPEQNNQLSLSYPLQQNNTNNQYPSQNAPVIIIPNLNSNQPKEEPKKEQVVVEKEKPLITSEALQIIIEEKQLKLEIKVLLDKIYNKLDEISRKLDETGYTNSKEVVPGITTRSLLQCIQKVVSQNEELNNELQLRSIDDIELDFDD